MPRSRRTPKRSLLPNVAQTEIGNQLRELYARDEVPLPDTLARSLHRLDSHERTNATKSELGRRRQKSSSS